MKLEYPGKVKQFLYRPCELLEIEASRFQDNRHMNVVRLWAFTLQETFLVLISVRGWVDHRARVRPEGLCEWKTSDIIGNRTHALPACSALP